MNAPSWLGITPPLWCIYSDTPRPAGTYEEIGAGRAAAVALHGGRRIRLGR